MTDAEKLAEILGRNRASTRLWADAKRAREAAKEIKDAAEDFDAETRRILAGFDEDYPLFDAPGADAPAATFSDAEMAALMDAAEDARRAEAKAMVNESFPAPGPVTIVGREGVTEEEPDPAPDDGTREPEAPVFGIYLGHATSPMAAVRAPSLKLAQGYAREAHGRLARAVLDESGRVAGLGLQVVEVFESPKPRRPAKAGAARGAAR